LWDSGNEGANYLEELSQFERIEPGIKRGLMRVFMELPRHTKKSLGMNIALFYLIEGNNTLKVLNSCVNSRKTETRTQLEWMHSHNPKSVTHKASDHHLHDEWEWLAAMTPCWLLSGPSCRFRQSCNNLHYCQRFQGKQLYTVKSWHLRNFISSIETTVKT